MCKTVTVVFKAKCVRTNCLRRKIRSIRRFLFQMEEQPEDFGGWLFFERELWESMWHLIRHISSMSIKGLGVF